MPPSHFLMHQIHWHFPRFVRNAVKYYTRENFQLTQSVGFHLNRARNSLLMEMDAALRPLDITAQQMGILLMLVRGMASTPLEPDAACEDSPGDATRRRGRPKAAKQP